METRSSRRTANAIIEDQLHQHLGDVEKALSADVLTFIGPIMYGVDDLIRDAIENRPNRSKRLAVVLETGGGIIEVAQRIADILRHHYAYVEFVIPNTAMSAGTVLVMSGDAIRMDYYSTLGPIDPQVQRPGNPNVWIPALGYLIQYERLIEKSRKGQLTTAEATFLIQKFDPAELYRYEQARQLSITLLKQWLVKYKFRNWRRTATRNIKVSRKMKEQRAEEIAKILNDTDRWHTHSRGISMDVLRKDLKLVVEDFGGDLTLNNSIRTYYRLLTDYTSRRDHQAVIHVQGTYMPIRTGGTQ